MPLSKNVWNIIRINENGKNLKPGQVFAVYAIDLGDKVMTHTWIAEDCCMKYCESVNGFRFWGTKFWKLN